MDTTLPEFLISHPELAGLGLTPSQCQQLASVLARDLLPGFLAEAIQETEAIMAIDPRLPHREILEIAAERIVRALGAQAATLRLFDPKSLQMLNFGAFGLAEDERANAVPAADSVAGWVVSQNRSLPVPSILKNPLYKNKEIVAKRGFHSLLAVPLRIPRFVGDQSDTLGSLQIYYPEDDRVFDRMEIMRAEVLARRVSHVLARKKILALQELNARKEAISHQIYVILTDRRTVKLKDLFDLLSPELSSLIQLLSCSLFTVADDQRALVLETGYPPDATYHEMGHAFTVEHHPYFAAAIQAGSLEQDGPCERLDPNYLLIRDPVRSELTSPGLRRFVEERRVHSILLVPLRVGRVARHLIAFYATAQKEYFTDEEIELLTHFGKELMKAARLEFLGDVLHDVKNPAVAIAGLAARARKLLDRPNLEDLRSRLAGLLDVVVSETSRLQDLAVTTAAEGRAEILDLSALAVARYRINAEVARETRRQEVTIQTPDLGSSLFVFCPRFALERVLDNLLANATKAVPAAGGFLALHTFRDGPMACLAISNSGEIPAPAMEAVRTGTVQGRGLNIIRRFVQTNMGQLDVRTDRGTTTFTICLPLYAGPPNPDGLSGAGP
ncbi:MAG: GAF domain-containing sensor histidine kinase, partial [Thermodesulfobacteriota bacterium]